MGKGQELLAAAREGDTRNVDKIITQITKRSGPFPSLRRGAGVNVQDEFGNTPLHHACLRGHTEIVRLLLSVDASPCIADKKGGTPLHYAAFNGHADIVAMLLAHNNPPVNINHQMEEGETALLIAAWHGKVEVAKHLLLRGANVFIRNNKEESALDLAVQYGRKEIVAHLLRACPEVIKEYRIPGKTYHTTPLHRASQAGHKEIVLKLISAGIDPNIRTVEGSTPLHEAVVYNRASVARVLLENGASLDAHNKMGQSVYDLLSMHTQEATAKIRGIIQEYESMARNCCESEDEPPCFPVSPTGYPMKAGMKAPETQKSTNNKESLLSPPSSSLTKSHPQSFVKKLASKCLGLKAKFNSAPNISNSSGLDSDIAPKSKYSEQKSSTNTLHIGNSKFFKILLKKEESGDIACNDEFDTISLDRLGTLNRDSVVNRSNRSCPGFKTSLPNISENNELSESRESVAESVIITELNIEAENHSPLVETYNTKLSIFEPRNISSSTANISRESANLINECYESYEFSKSDLKVISIENGNGIPLPPPRTTAIANECNNNCNKSNIYENVVTNNVVFPTPATRSHINTKNESTEAKNNIIYENIILPLEKKPEPTKRTLMSHEDKSNCYSKDSSPNLSRTSTLSSDSMIDESNLEDILLSEKSRSFRHSNKLSLVRGPEKKTVARTKSNDSNVSESSDFTEASAMENVDCTGDLNEDSDSNPGYLSMTGTLPNRNSVCKVKRKVLFRHKTFTNMEIDRNSTNVKDLPKWNCDFLKETLAHYHIRGTGHCIYKAPTVQEFINSFNKDTLCVDSNPLHNTRRDSYFETALCFCRPSPPKHHKSAEDFLEIQDSEGKVSIDMELLRKTREMVSSSFRCYCESGTCTLHEKQRDFKNNFIVKFSAIKKSISTPDITLNPSSIPRNSLVKNTSVPYDLQMPVVNVKDTVAGNEGDHKDCTDFRSHSPSYTILSNPSTMSSSSARPYSIKDISEVISLNEHSISTLTNPSCASDVSHLSLRKSSSSEYSGHWSLQSCNSNVTVKSDLSFKTCLEESSEEDSDDDTLHTDEESSDAETIKSDVSTSKRPWVHSDSFRFGNRKSQSDDVILEEDSGSLKDTNSLKFESLSKVESGISVGFESSSSACEEDNSIPRIGSDVSLGTASLERGSGVVGDVRSGSGRRRWDEMEGASEGDALSVSSAASSCAAHHLGFHHEYSKVSPTPPKKPPRRNLSVSPTHANSPSSGYSYELRSHARSQDDLDDIQGSKLYLKHGRSVDQYVDGKLSYSEYEENYNSPRVIPVPNPRPSLKNRTQPVAITAMYENVVIKEQNPRRKLKRNNFSPQYENHEPRMNDVRVRKYSNQERSSLESLLDSQSMNSPSDCERYYEGHRLRAPSSPTHYDQPPTPDHPPPSARQAENSIHERIRPLSQLIMEVVEEIRIRKKSQGDDVSENR